MKIIKFFFVLLLLLFTPKYLLSQSGNLDTSFVLLASPNFDYRNPQFDKAGSSVNYSIKDCIFAYEKWSSSSNANVVVRFMTYNSLSPEINLTNDLFLNINPSVAYSVEQFSTENNNGAVVFQSNKNGNWDIFFSRYNTINWSVPVAIASDSVNETLPSIISYKVNNTTNYLIAYEKGNDIYLKNYFNGIWMNEVNITSSDSLNCISPKLTNFQGSFYIAYQRKLINAARSIAFQRGQVSSTGDFTFGPRKIIYQPQSQDNIRFSNGINYSILNYDYDTLGVKNFYSAILKYDNYILTNQTLSFGGNNYGGTGSSHGDITLDYLSGYTLYSWIRKVQDSTQIVITPNYYLSLRKFYVGNSNEETFVNTSTKLVFGNPYTLYRIRILWEKIINGRTAIIESFRDQYLTSVSNVSNITPEIFSLEQNFPNPFNPKTIIIYSIPTTQYTILKIYDALGKEVATLVNENLSAGEYKVEFDGSNYSSGIYFYKLLAGDFIETKRMILLK